MGIEIFDVAFRERTTLWTKEKMSCVNCEGERFFWIFKPREGKDRPSQKSCLYREKGQWLCHPQSRCIFLCLPKFEQLIESHDLINLIRTFTSSTAQALIHFAVVLVTASEDEASMIRLPEKICRKFETRCRACTCHKQYHLPSGQSSGWIFFEG